MILKNLDQLLFKKALERTIFKPFERRKKASMPYGVVCMLRSTVGHDHHYSLLCKYNVTKGVVYHSFVSDPRTISLSPM